MLIGSAPAHLYFGVENYKNMNAVEYKHMASVESLQALTVADLGEEVKGLAKC